MKQTSDNPNNETTMEQYSIHSRPSQISILLMLFYGTALQRSPDLLPANLYMVAIEVGTALFYGWYKCTNHHEAHHVAAAENFIGDLSKATFHVVGVCRDDKCIDRSHDHLRAMSFYGLSNTELAVSLGNVTNN